MSKIHEDALEAARIIFNNGNEPKPTGNKQPHAPLASTGTKPLDNINHLCVSEQ